MSIGSRHRNFPGTDRRTSERYASDVDADENDIIAAIRALRETEGQSLEALGFLLGLEPAQLSRHLNCTRATSLKNFLRTARALGYRCRMVFTKAEADCELKPVAKSIKLQNEGASS